MSRTKKGTPPSYRKHSSGQAVVTLPLADGKRKDILLGPHGSPESHAEYRRQLGEWEVNRHSVPDVGTVNDLTMNELMLRYLDYAEGYYVKEGEPTSEQATIRHALGFVKDLYGHTLAREFGPLALKAARDVMIKHPVVRRFKEKNPETGKAVWREKLLHRGLARRFINKQISRIKRMFSWAVEEELLPVTVHQTLLRVRGLKKGKDGAREKPRIKPVPDAWIEAVRPHLGPMVSTMVEVQRLSGCRPQDVVGLRAIDLDMTGPVWEYRPSRYKTEHHNDEDSTDRERIVFLGPKAQELLKPFLTLNVTDHLFSPKRSEDQRNAGRREQRQTKMWPSHARRNARRCKRPAIRDRYDVGSYRRAIRRACQKAGIPVWFPLQLRHSRGTEIRKRFGLEASQAVLGHSELGVTQVYAEVDRETARRVMGEIG